MPYTAQVGDIRHTLTHITDLPSQIDTGFYGELDLELADAVLEEAGRFATEVIAPLNQTGDVEGARLEDGTVAMPDGWAEAYRQWVEAGWGALPGPEDFGGQHLPLQIGLAAQELWNTASNAFGIGTVLTQGAVEAFAAHASDELKARYLEKLVTGEWTGTMNLTEPQAGSDLAALRAKAVPNGDGSYAITGTKIYITYGDHELTDNIVHLVLARLPDAPEGTRGISLFAVPKYLPGEDGAPGRRNDVKCTKLEEKLGIHASPTCVMAFGEEGGATAWLIGEENRGLACMFTMMNNARLHVGIQGVAIAERAYQQALDHAHERRQGRRPGSDGMVAIVEHPDVQRMLLTMKALTAGARAVCYATARAIDLSHRAASEEERTQGRGLADLLTPVAKAFSTDIGVEVASLGVQVHGGMGYVEETGAAQHLRDARIAPIYEGTNGIQAIDLVTRKVPMAGGDVVHGYLATLREDVDRAMASNAPGLGQAGYALSSALEALEEATDWLLQTLAEGEGGIDPALAGAAPYLRLFGLVAGGAGLARGALSAHQAGEADAPERLHLARFFAERLAVEGPALARVVTTGSQALTDMPAGQLAV